MPLVSFKCVFVLFLYSIIRQSVSRARVCVCVRLCVHAHVTMIACQSKVFAAERDRGAKLKGTFVSS